MYFVILIVGMDFLVLAKVVVIYCRVVLRLEVVIWIAETVTGKR